MSDRLFFQFELRPCLRSWVAAVLLSLPLCGLAADGPRVAELDPKHRGLIEDHCLSCHNEEKHKGKFRLDDLALKITTLEGAERWQKVLNALNSGDMPPEEEKQPERMAKLEFLDALAGTMVQARKALGDQGGVGLMRRLNRREYKTTLREELGVELDVSELPADGGGENFDTTASSLFMSSDQFEQYYSLAKDALDEAFERYVNPVKPLKRRFEAEENSYPRILKSLQERMDERRRYSLWTQALEEVAKRPENKAAEAEIRATIKKHPVPYVYMWEKLAGAPSPTQFGFKDAVAAEHEGVFHWALVPHHTMYVVQPESRTGAFLTLGDAYVNSFFEFAVGSDWPAGDYVVRLRVAASANASPERRFMEFAVRSAAGSATTQRVYEITGTMEAPQIIAVPVSFPKSGGRHFLVRERGTQDDDDQPNQKFAEARRKNGIGPDLGIWVDWAEVENSPAQAQVLPPALAALGIPLDDPAQEITEVNLRAGFQRFAQRVFRGKTPSSTSVDRVLAIYHERKKAGAKHGAALREALAVFLASPRFLYLAEPNVEQTRRPLNGPELATRLSYFLWGGPPDSTLMDLANRGELLRPEVLGAQAERLLNDPRVRGFVGAFSHQWLGLDRLTFFQFNLRLYPSFDLSTRNAVRQEIYETFGLLLAENGSLRQFLKSDYVVINSLLANYYGIVGVTGDEYRKVKVPEGSPRGGLIGTAAVMAMGSNGERTSPVDRGAWVLRKLMHDSPPPAPPNVPQLNRLESKLLTTRERLQAHQEEPQCASCHRKIDPIGFGLENFDAAGRWRTEDHYAKSGLGEKKWTIDPEGAFHHGPAFKDYFELRNLLASKAEPFARGFCEALVEYALGRPCGFSEEELLSTMMERGRNKDFAIRELIQALVSGREFQSK